MPIVSTETFIASYFDVIVIGGGTSGLVVATRLSEDPSLVVGVIEAGEDHAGDPAVSIPGMMGRNTRNTKYDYEFYTVPQKYVNGRKIQSSRGKGLGGSSMLNNLAFVRPTCEELDALESLGNEGWNWTSLLSYMKKSEHLCAPVLSADEAKAFAGEPDPTFHGTEGPIAVSFPPYISPLHTDILDSLECLGVHRNSESGAGRTVGSLLIPTSVDPQTATRSYSASAYLAPNIARSNLIVLTEAVATKIHLVDDGTLKRAVAVDFTKNGQINQVKVKKEVILSAGTFQTPQLLEISGIGDPRILGSLNIDCIISLPGVGENLQDHVKVPTIVQIDQQIQSVEVLRDEQQLKIQQELYKKHQGILAGMPSSCFAFLPGEIIGSRKDVEGWAASSNIEGSAPDVFQDTHPDVLRGISKQYKIMAEWIDNPNHPLAQLLNMNGHFPVAGLTPDPSKRFMSLLCAYTHPFSRGTVHAMSKDALEPPSIQPNYLSNRSDLEILAKAVKFTLELYSTKPLANSIVAPLVPSFTKEAGDDAQIEEYVKEIMTTVHHPVGTASMLPRADGGVVDASLCVYETSNLRVVDCSIIPLQISSNIVSLAYAIGEKAADIIKADIRN